MSNVRKETLSGVKWQFLSKLTLQPVIFLFGMILTLCLGAPWFTDFFKTPVQEELAYASALMVFLNSTATVHWTLYSARRDFKTTALYRRLCLCLLLLSHERSTHISQYVHDLR